MLIENGLVNPALLSLVRLCGLTVSDENPRSVNDLLQREWVKTKDGGFRVQIGGRNPTDAELGLLSQLGFVDEISINHGRQYSGTLILGATLKAVTRRMWFLVREKFRVGGLEPDVGFFRPINAIGSLRPLLDLEMKENVPQIIEETGAPLLSWEDERFWPDTEVNMMSCVARWLNVSGVVPFHGRTGIKSDGLVRPANTDETIREFFNDDAVSAGHYLLVSSQPACQNQLLAARRVVSSIGDDITFDVAGPDAPAMPLARWLDTVAKQLWEEVQLLPKS